jgi:hypothetical protein
LAANNRSASSNPRASYVITQLPTQYNDNAVVDNPNSAVGVSGIKKVTYTGYHDDNVAFTDTATVTDTTTANNFAISNPGNTVPGDPPENITVLYTGYLLATYTGTWTFVLSSDDASYLWIGNTALTGYTTSNELATASYAGPGTATISLTACEYYPIRLLYGNGPSEGFLALTYAHTGQSATSDFTGKLFSPGVSLVQGRPWTGIGIDDPANAAEPEATAWVLMDGPFGDENGFYGGQSWRKMAPIGYAPYGRETYQYVDEVVRFDGTVWLYENATIGLVATGGNQGQWPWQATWTGSYKGTKITAAYVKTTNYPAVP